MMRANRRRLSAAAIGAMYFVCAAMVSAQEPKQLHEKHDSLALHKSLGDVINLGAKLFNDQSDYAGCYRLFQGSLLSVRPFLADDLQKRIDKGLASAEKQPTYADRAWELRAVLDDVRKTLKPADPKNDKDLSSRKKKKDLPSGGVGESVKLKPQAKKDETKKSEAANSAQAKPDQGQLGGRLTFHNMPVGGGYYVTLVRGDKRFSCTVQKDGSFKFATPIPPGEYAVAIEPIRGDAFKGVPLPPRYAGEATSGLSLTVQAGKQQVDLNLVK
jgi:hypothetical protein